MRFFLMSGLLFFVPVMLPGSVIAEEGTGLSGIVQPVGKPVVRVEMDSPRAGISFPEKG